MLLLQSGILCATHSLITRDQPERTQINCQYRSKGKGWSTWTKTFQSETGNLPSRTYTHAAEDVHISSFVFLCVGDASFYTTVLYFKKRSRWRSSVQIEKQLEWKILMYKLNLTVWKRILEKNRRHIFSNTFFNNIYS